MPTNASSLTLSQAAAVCQTSTNSLIHGLVYWSTQIVKKFFPRTHQLMGFYVIVEMVNFLFLFCCTFNYVRMNIQFHISQNS